MPSDYETACGTFDPASKTVFINAEHLNAKPDYEKAFFLFHELRHASQYLCPEHFGSEIHRSLQYVIGYDGTCYKLVNGHYISCKLDGNEDYFTNLYLGQPHEVDANTFAYKQVKQLYGDSKELKHCLIFGCLAILSLPTHTISYFRKSTKVFLVYHLWRKRYDFHAF